MDKISIEDVKSYVISFNISTFVSNPDDIGDTIEAMEEKLKHIGFTVDNVEYEEL